MAEKQQVISLSGSLDLITDKLTVSPGTAKDMANYEVGVVRGPRRIDGFSRWDGRRNLASATTGIYSFCDTVDASPTGWTVGASVTVTYSSSVDGGALTVGGLVIAVSNDDSGGGLYVHAVTVILTEAPLHFEEATQVTSISGYAFPGTLQSSFIVAPAAALDTYYRSLVTALPGNSSTRIPGLHFFDDKLYAVVDLTAIEVTPTTASVGWSEGADLYASTQTATFGTVARVRPSATSGNLILELFDFTPAITLAAGADLYWLVSSGNLCLNGNFFSAEPAAGNWTAGGGSWVFTSGASGIATATLSNTTITSSLAAEAGFAYDVTYTVTRSAGSVVMTFGGATGATRSTAGTFTDSIVSSSTAALVFTGTGFSGTIDDVSAKKTATTIITNGDFASGTDWTTGAGWTIASGVAAAVTAGGTLTHARAATSGFTYRITYTVVRTAGSLTPSFGGVSGTTRTASGSYVDFITATGAGVLTFTSGSFSGTLDDVVVTVVAGVADYVGVAEPKYAAMYSADWDGSGGWTRVDMGREISYDEGAGATDATAFFLAYLPSAFSTQISAAEVKDTGWVGADSWNEYNVSGRSWGSGGTPPELSAVDTQTVASSAGVGFTNYLRAYFSAGLLDVPPGAVIMGVEVRINRWATAGTAFDEWVQIGKTGNVISLDNKALNGFAYAYAVSPGATITYPPTNGNKDLWRLALTPNDINDGGFHVRLRCTQVSAGVNVSVDEIAVKVYYQEQARKAYIYDSSQTPKDQEIEVISYTVARGASGGTASGGGATGDRKGVLTINPAVTPVDVEKPWQITAGKPIYTQPLAAGVILAYTASDDEPVLLPSSYAIADEDARYVFDTANPYARDGSDVFFIYQGVTHGYMFDGTYAMPMQTGLLEQFEKPRHGVWTGNFNAMAGRAGTVQISDLGNPLVYIDAASTATEIGASDSVTGLLKLKGDSLGVFTEQTIFAIQGATTADFQRISISPSSGAIEYTVLDMGMPMFCDYRGIATIQTTDQYGDFNRGRLSWAASPWLLQRLQSDQRNQTVDKTVVGALAIRNKNQYRVEFADGWRMTLTLQSGDTEAALTTQRIYGDWQDRDVSAIKVLAMCSGVTSTGQDLAFMTFDSDPESSRYRYVFQIDAGRSFDGEEIYAYWMSQPLVLGAPFFTKELQQLGVIGKSFGYCAFKVFCATDFTDPVSDETTATSTDGYTMEFGQSTDAASATEQDKKSIKSIRANGEDFTFMFESISATNLPHTLQALVVRYDDKGQKS